MVDTLRARVGRVIAGGVHALLDKLEDQAPEAMMQQAVRELDKVARVVKLGVFVNSTADYTDHPKVANGASDLMVAVFGDRGRHTRFALGLVSLPIDMTVNIEGVFEIGPARAKRALRSQPPIPARSCRFILAKAAAR